MQRGQRQSNIELLRIVAMVMIVAHHFAVHSGFDFAFDTLNTNRFWIQFIQIGGKIGVDVFVLISGYFLVSSPTVKVSRAMRLWGQIFFYSVLLFAVFALAGIEPFGIEKLIRHIAPITFSQWWFASAYFVLYLLTPYINRLIGTFDRRQYVRFLILLFILWCVIPTITSQPFESNGLLWFVFLYAFAGYLRLFGIKTELNGPRTLLIAFALILLTFGSAVLFDVLGTKIAFFATHTTFFYEMQKLPIVAISVLMFSGFSRLNIRHSKIINVISSATFGVYLIHDIEHARPFLWTTVFHGASYAESNLLIPYSLMAIAAVFIGCTMIELARIHLIEKNLMPAINRLAKFAEDKTMKLFDALAERMQL